MSTTERNQKQYKGILSGLKARLQKNRLGELLVLDGFISPVELRQALLLSKSSHKTLGQVLVEQDLVDRSIIRQTLVEQFMLRFTTAAVTVFLSLASMGVTKSARAGTIKDVPSLMKVANVSFAPVNHYPKLFGSTEKRSSNLKAFTKWTGMFSRFDAAFKSTRDKGTIDTFKRQISGYQNLPLHKMAVKVNDLANKQRYITDARNYGKSDYWATPVEFFNKGGDCEDFAIAKYTALRALGVPEERLRLAIVQDMKKNIPHAVLIVYTDHGALLLDNQIKTVVNVDRVDHYKPIFSINRDAWWLHTKPRANVTILASAAQ